MRFDGGIDDGDADIAPGGDAVQRIEFPFAGIGLDAIQRIAAAGHGRRTLCPFSLSAILMHRLGPFDAGIVRQRGRGLFRRTAGRHGHDVAVEPGHRHRPVVDQLQPVRLGPLQGKAPARAGAGAAVIAAAIAGVRREMGRRQAQQDQDFMVFVGVGDALRRRIGGARLAAQQGKAQGQQKQADTEHEFWSDATSAVEVRSLRGAKRAKAS